MKTTRVLSLIVLALGAPCAVLAQGRPSEKDPLPLVRSVKIPPYVLKEGDVNMNVVSQKVYGSDRYGDALLAFNRDHPLVTDQIRAKPPRFVPGQMVYIPPKEILALKYREFIVGFDSPPPRDRSLLLLWPEGAPGAKGPLPEGVKDGKLTIAAGAKLSKVFNDPKLADLAGVVVFPAPESKANGAAVVVCPGGGYSHLAADHEGEAIAGWLNSLGVTAVVLKYRLGPRYHYPTQLHDAQRAIRLTRHNAKKWGVDPARVGILGFSAGGHLASTALTQFDDGQADAKDAVDRHGSRPDFGILLYPVIRLDGPHAHGGSRVNLLGKDADAKLIDSLNNDQRVTPKTPPTFLVHTSEDRGVPPENSALFYIALSRNKVPAELHIYEKGAHGLGLGPAGLPYSSWPERCAAWLQGRGILKGAK